MILLAVQAAVFAVWGVLMFRTLFRLRRRAIESGAGPMPGVMPTLAAWGDFLTRPAHRGERRLLGAVTLALFALSGLHAFLLT
jgi:hypothetical protein